MIMSAIKHFLHNLQSLSDPMRYIDPERRNDLMEAYCNEVVNNMSVDDLMETVFSYMYHETLNYTDDECLAEIEDLHFNGDKKEAAEFARKYITEDEAMNYFKSNISDASDKDWKDFWYGEDISEPSEATGWQ